MNIRYSRIKNYFSIALIAMSLMVVACSGGGTESATNEGGDNLPATNPFDNGFRVVKETTDNLLFDSVDSTTTFEYHDSENQIIRTQIYEQGTADERVYTRNLNVNDAGWLMGGSYVAGNDNYTTIFAYDYDAQGKLLEYDGDFYTLNFRYQDGILAKIVDSNNYETVFAYDDTGRLVSTTESVSSVTTSLEYNAAGQISRAAEVNQFDEPGYTYEFEYDANANLIKQTQIRSRGDIYSVTTYDYEVAPGPMYNHHIFRMMLQPFDNVFFSYIID